MEKCKDIKQYACQPQLCVVFYSCGIMDIHGASIWKLLALLYQRFRLFNNGSKSGLVIVADKLQLSPAMLESRLIELAHNSKMKFDFIDWIEQCNCFCDKKPRSIKIESCYEI